MKPTFAPCWCCRGTGVEKTFQDIKPKLTYYTIGDAEYSTICGNTIEIHTSGDGAYRAMLNGQLLTANPVYSTPDAAKLAAERAVLEMAKVVVEILG